MHAIGPLWFLYPCSIQIATLSFLLTRKLGFSLDHGFDSRARANPCPLCPELQLYDLSILLRACSYLCIGTPKVKAGHVARSAAGIWYSVHVRFGSASLARPVCSATMTSGAVPPAPSLVLRSMFCSCMLCLLDFKYYSTTQLYAYAHADSRVIKPVMHTTQCTYSST